MISVNDKRKRKVAIKTALLQQGEISQKSIANALGISEGAVSLFISGTYRSRRFDDYLTNELGIDVASLMPSPVPSPDSEAVDGD